MGILLDDLDIELIYGIVGSDYKLKTLQFRSPKPPVVEPTGLELLGIKDISADLATNPGPYTGKDSSGLRRDGGWYPRTLAQIDGLTYHHTMSDSPEATARHYIGKDGGRPTTPYTIWITQTGEILLCVAMTEGLWHDHTGHENTHLSVGLAGSLHLYEPSAMQLDAAAWMAFWAIRDDYLPAITSIDHIKGHMDYIGTDCPGWIHEASGHWKPKLYSRIAERLVQG